MLRNIIVELVLRNVILKMFCCVIKHIICQTKTSESGIVAERKKLKGPLTEMEKK
jgi:hypothetical protein